LVIKFDYKTNNNVWIHIKNLATDKQWIHWCGVQKPIEIQAIHYNLIDIKFSNDTSKYERYAINNDGTLRHVASIDLGKVQYINGDGSFK